MPNLNNETNALEDLTGKVACSIRDLPPLETGGVEARKGIGIQDHVAARFCISMLTGEDLKEVWCERHDDITLVWRRPDGELVEFVQVKSNELDQLWSVALVCQRERKPTTPNGGGTSILERSLANDRGCEPCQFRMITCRAVNSSLKVLTFERGCDYRIKVQEGVDALRKLLAEISEKVGDFRSEKGNDCAFWLERTLWEEIHGLDSVRDGNLLALTNALDQMNEFAAPDQRDDLYRRIVNKAWDAAACDWRDNPQGKRITPRIFYFLVFRSGCRLAASDEIEGQDAAKDERRSPAA